MIQLLVFTLAVFGVAYVLGYAKITFQLRSKLDRPGFRKWLLDLLECVACTSWWMGNFAFLAGIAPEIFYTWRSLVVGQMVCAFYCCASSLILAKFTGLTDD